MKMPEDFSFSGLPGKRMPFQCVDESRYFNTDFFYSHQVEQPLRSKKCVWQKLLSKQRKRAVVACFRMAPLYNLPRYDCIHHTYRLYIFAVPFLA